MRTSSLPLARGLVSLVTLLAMSGCGGSKPAPPEESITSAPPPPAPVVEEPIVREEPAPVAVVPPALEPIHFAFNEDEITSDATIALQNVSVVMKEHPDWTLLLEGHCDERGTNEYNVALGENRAQAAKRYLVSLGVGAERVQTVSYGEERPVDLSATEASWAKNRRAEFRAQP